MSLPAKLTHAEDHSSGCVFLLNDARRISVDVSYADIDRYLTVHGFPSLETVARSGKADVYTLPIRMTRTDWLEISNILTTSDVAQLSLANFPALSAGLQLEFDVIESLPQRLYGGIGEPALGVSPTFYLSHQIDFTASTDRGDNWRYALLSHRGGYLFKTYVNIQSRAVEIDNGLLDNHFVECQVNARQH